jgi:hypothetical protein
MFLTKHKYLLRQHKAVECDGNCVDMDPIFGVDNDSSNDEMASNKYSGSTEVSGSDVHTRLLADTVTSRKLKGREVFTVPFQFLCDYVNQSGEHMDFIAVKLESRKAEVADFHQQRQLVTGSVKAETVTGMKSSSLSLEKVHVWVRGGTHKNG